jgi:hypothetical protein
MPYLTATEVRELLDHVFADTTKFPDALLDNLISSFEAVAEEYRGVAYTPRTAVEAHTPLRGSGGVVLRRPAATAVTEIDVDGDTLDPAAYRLLPADGIVVVRGGFSAWWGTFPPVVTVTYTHGFTAVPQPILDACAEYVRGAAMVRTSKTSRDVIYTSAQGTTTRYSTPDPAKGRPTGWTECDRLLNSMADYRTPAVW